MDGVNYSFMDIGAYIQGIFFAAAFIMTSYGAWAGLKSVKGIEIPLGIVGLIGGYLWWTGEDINPLHYLF